MSGIEYRVASDDLELIVSRQRAMRYPLHFHRAHWALGEVLSGSVMLARPDGRFRLQTGDRFAVPPRAPHSLVVAQNSALAVWCLDATRVDPHDWRAKAGDGLSPDPDMRAWFEAARRLATRSPTSPALAEIAQRLCEKPDEKCSIPDMARRAALSPWQFVRAFARETGMTPHAFQLICRLSLARRLLYAGVAAADAAVASGFADQSHLHKVFRRHHGLTPRQFLAAIKR